jgi:hypothetical protein
MLEITSVISNRKNNAELGDLLVKEEFVKI